MTIHDRAYHRAKSWSKALRKYHIDRAISSPAFPPTFSNLHQYADNHFFCNCPMCRRKTNNKNRSGGRGWELSKNWSVADQKKLDNMISQVEDLNT